MPSRARRTPPRSRKMPPALTRGYDRFLRIALSLPGAETSTSYGTPSVKVKGKLLSRWRTEAEGAVAIRCDFLDRQILLLAQPEVYFLTDHYRDYPMVLMRIDKASREAMTDALERAWRLVAPAKLVRLQDEKRPPPAS